MKTSSKPRPTQMHESHAPPGWSMWVNRGQSRRLQTHSDIKGLFIKLSKNPGSCFIRWEGKEAQLYLPVSSQATLPSPSYISGLDKQAGPCSQPSPLTEIRSTSLTSPSRVTDVEFRPWWNHSRDPTSQLSFVHTHPCYHGTGVNRQEFHMLLALI